MTWSFIETIKISTSLAKQYNSTYKSHLSRHLVIDSECPLVGNLMRYISTGLLGWKHVLLLPGCILRKRNKVADRLAKVASDRNTDVQLFVNFLEEMLDEFGFDKVVEYPAIIPKANVSLPIPSSQLVENLCNGKVVQNCRFCLKALSTPKVIASMDTTQLGTLIMKLGAANVKAT
ncbi:hypothetical protein Gogos_020032, partial [Gossypium gossypioides]|nr:hypothetical protein [Gossypium gossypioides]